METTTRTNLLRDQDLAVLRCPRTRQKLRWAKRNERDGTGADDALVSVDGQFLYRIKDGIIRLLASEAQPLSGPVSAQALDPVKNGLRRFYDEVGWTRSDESFTDARLFEDLRPVASEYCSRTRSRVAEPLVASGRYFLDVASGPVQFPEYVRYSDQFERRLCVDLSEVALRAAKDKLGERAICILGDITNLPLADGAMDAAISLHTIYHVPAAQQETAFREVQRVLAPGKPGVVVYNWGNRFYWKLLHAPVSLQQRAASLRRKLTRRARTEREPTLENGFYYSPYNHRWFTRRDWKFPTEIRVWRAASTHSLQIYAHERWGGRALLRAVYAAEERWPSLMGRLGQYPMIVIWGTDPAMRQPSASIS